MGQDGIFLTEVKKEIADVLDGTRIDKIFQPSRDEIVILFRASGVAKKLLLSVRPSSPRVCFTESTPENPPQPPMFCMLLRKHLSGARFLSVGDDGAERMVTFVLLATDEMGDRSEVRLAAEFIGKQTNLILIRQDGRIIDALRRSDIESGGRMIQPGAIYEKPERQSKLSVTENSAHFLADAVINRDGSLCTALIDVLDGVSPLISREICTLAHIDTAADVKTIGGSQKESLCRALDDLKNSITHPQPTAVLGADGVPFEFSYRSITQYGDSAVCKSFEDFSALLETVYAERDRRERLKALASDLVRLLKNLHARAAKKVAVREKELSRCKDGEKYRILGELLKTYGDQSLRGVPYVDVPNYYDPECKLQRVPLDTSLSVTQNAQKYFKEYKKSCNAAAVLGDLIAESRQELIYIESVMDELERAKTAEDLREIRDELAAAGYIRGGNMQNKRKNAGKNPIEMTSPDGFKVLIGRNNRQNDELTLKIADKTDWWFHTKNIPGSHVIVRSDGNELPESTVMFAALIAAKNSKAANSSSVPVDYTKVKYVKKPAGAKPGMVIYKTNRTVFVTPIEVEK